MFVFWVVLNEFFKLVFELGNAFCQAFDLVFNVRSRRFIAGCFKAIVFSCEIAFELAEAAR